MQIAELYQIYQQHPHISTDSRNISKGDLFFALKGGNFNGNIYAENAIKKGAAYAIVDEKEFASHPQTILVDDCLKCLQLLANYYRNTFQIPIIAITGTNGKTTTKELVACVLKQQYKLHYTEGNFNNHIGVPLTLLSMPKNTEIAVIEMGANHLGEIQELCEIAEPNYGLITNVGKAHLEGFGSFEGVIKTKTELYRFLKEKNGSIFINNELDLLVEQLPYCKTISYGKKEGSDIAIAYKGAQPYVEVEFDSLQIKTKMIGKYNFDNIAAAIAIGTYFELNATSIQNALESYIPQNNRSQIVKTQKNTLILDAYNANPTSMRAALENFAMMNTPSKYLILGDMFELGDESIEEHKALIKLIQSYHFSNICFVGEIFHSILKNTAFLSFKNTDEAMESYTNKQLEGNTILIKGSRGVQLEKLKDVL